MPIYITNDNVVVLENLKDDWANAGAGEFIVSGTVQTQIKDSAGVAVGAAISMTYFAQKAGIAGHFWMGGIEEDVVLTEGAEYTLVVDVDAGTDRKGHWEQIHRALRRTS